MTQIARKWAGVWACSSYFLRLHDLAHLARLTRFAHLARLTRFARFARDKLIQVC
jgi:hypothetical protein